MTDSTGLDLTNLVAIDVHTHVHRSVAAPAGAQAGESLAAMATYFKTSAAGYTVDELAGYYRERKMAAVAFTVDIAGEPPDRPARRTRRSLSGHARTRM